MSLRSTASGCRSSWPAITSRHSILIGPPKIAPTYTFEWFDVVHPDDYARDDHRIQEHLVALYERRFERQRALFDAVREPQLQKS